MTALQLLAAAAEDMAINVAVGSGAAIWVVSPAWEVALKAAEA